MKTVSSVVRAVVGGKRINMSPERQSQRNSRSLRITAARAADASLPTLTHFSLLPSDHRM